jgi:threonylcarbamoyladenosine tRNA methylthiotransferase MtaB
LNPFFSITTDYIAGFATETEELFLNSVNNLEKLPLAHMHIFPYSSRPFTAASHLRNLVNDSVKKQRINILEKVNEKLNVQYLRRFIGKTVNVLFEKTDDLNLQHGHSEYHFMVFVKTTKRLSSELLSVKISEFKNKQLFGILV